jgi:hypothetical protein
MRDTSTVPTYLIKISRTVAVLRLRECALSTGLVHLGRGSTFLPGR